MLLGVPRRVLTWDLLSKEAGNCKGIEEGGVVKARP